MSTEPSGDSPSPPPQSSPTQTPAIDKQLLSWETFTTDPTSRTFTPGGSNKLTSQPSVGKPCHSSGEIFHESSTHFVEIETKVRLGQMQELHNLKLKQEAELHEIKVEIEKTRLREAQLAIEIKEIQLARLNTNEHCGSY
uniref:Uncharacterized protein n=1 Tax=Timema monikensis TaxID=170555 RepID=A0A7R9HR78_9NEOP|nr:unnamed protein product [Timema monikensis]